MGGTFKLKPLNVDRDLSRLDASAVKYAVSIVKQDNLDFWKHCVLEKEEQRQLSASYWNIWANTSRAKNGIKKGAVIHERDLLDYIVQIKPFDDKGRNDRADIENFFRFRDYKLVGTIAHDDIGSFWFERPGEKAVLIKALKALKSN